MFQWGGGERELVCSTFNRLHPRSYRAPGHEISVCRPADYWGGGGQELMKPFLL